MLFIIMYTVKQMLSKSKLINDILGDGRRQPEQAKKTQFKPKWNNLPTTAIRIPEVFAEDLITFARQWDNNKPLEYLSVNSELRIKIKALIQKVNAKERGYKPNGASALIKELTLLLEISE